MDCKKQIEKLKQQLKEKDDETEKWKQKWVKTEKENLKLLQDIQSNTKQVCEKIGEEFEAKVKRSGFNSSFGVDMFWFRKLLKQIEKGEE